MTIKETANERSALRAFLLAEACALIAAIPFAAIQRLGWSPQSPAEVYWSIAARLSCWFGSAAIPASIAWMFLRASMRSPDGPRPIEVVRVLAVETLVMVLLVVSSVAIVPPYPDTGPEWSDVPLFGRLLFAMSILTVIGWGLARLALSAAWSTGLLARPTLRQAEADQQA